MEKTRGDFGDGKMRLEVLFIMFYNRSFLASQPASRTTIRVHLDFDSPLVIPS